MPRIFFDEPVGTGVAVSRLNLETLETEGPGQKVVRATEAWQIFARNRFWYGKNWERWHTIEGPAVLEHNRRYYCFYSGGNWREENYGVGYSVSRNILGPYETGPTKLLESKEPELRGPGHCSFLKVPGAPDPFIVFHIWDEDWSRRQMHIAKLRWRREEPVVDFSLIGLAGARPSGDNPD